MGKAAKELVDASAPKDMSQSDLDERRRNERGVLIVERLSERPDESIPQAMGGLQETEGYYRWVRNDQVTHQGIVEGHLEATAQRCEGLQTVRVLHDTSEMDFPLRDGHLRKHLGQLSTNRQGVSWHASLAVSADPTRAPLGLTTSRPFVHQNGLKDDQSNEFWDHRDGLLSNEKWRWFQNAKDTENRLDEVDKVVHIMGREGDDFEILAAMDAYGCDFVVRLTHDRRVSTGPSRWDYQRLSEALEAADFGQTRRVHLSKRPTSQASKTHPSRRARSANLALRSASVQLRRPDGLDADQAAARVQVNVVEVREIDPPDNADPVHWRLVCSLAVDSLDQLWAVVDHYRARWQIEEYFKSLKTGCEYLKTQHRSAKTLLAALGVNAVVAWELHVLRHLARHAEAIDGSAVPSPIQMAVLRDQKPEYLSDEPTASEAMRAVAAMGGHLPSNGPPGWLTTGRGWRELRTQAAAYKRGYETALRESAEK